MQSEESFNGENEVEVGESFKEKFFWLFDFLKMFLVMIVVIQNFLYRNMTVEGDSMQNTFQNNDNVSIMSDMWYVPKQGDVVIINTYDWFKKSIIKRIIALEGQAVDIDNDGEVYVDGVKLNEPYIKDGWKTNRCKLFNYPIKVPKGCFFAMGDNRLNSDDSRIFGFFKYNQSLGKVVLRSWPLRKFKFF